MCCALVQWWLPNGFSIRVHWKTSGIDYIFKGHVSSFQHKRVRRPVLFVDSSFFLCKSAFPPAIGSCGVAIWHCQGTSDRSPASCTVSWKGLAVSMSLFQEWQTLLKYPWSTGIHSKFRSSAIQSLVYQVRAALKAGPPWAVGTPWAYCFSVCPLERGVLDTGDAGWHFESAHFYTHCDMWSNFVLDTKT